METCGHWASLDCSGQLRILQRHAAMVAAHREEQLARAAIQRRLQEEAAAAAAREAAAAAAAAARRAREAAAAAAREAAARRVREAAAAAREEAAGGNPPLGFVSVQQSRYTVGDPTVEAGDPQRHSTYSIAGKGGKRHYKSRKRTRRHRKRAT